MFVFPLSKAKEAAEKKRLEEEEKKRAEEEKKKREEQIRQLQEAERYVCYNISLFFFSYF